MAPYVYKPLDLSSDAIRVLRLSRGSLFDSEIRCELIETYLGGVPYEALSYTWGSMDRPLKITVDASEFHVTGNLYTALQYLRLPYQDRFLWVDAICINQDSKEERGHQVGQMRLVYHRAEGVLIWLGTSNNCIDDFFEAMRDPRLRIVRTAGRKAVKASSDPELRTEFQAVVSMLMARPWFRRVWILQEVATARTATVMCGRNSMPTWLFASIPAIFDISVPDHCQAVLDIMPGDAGRSSWRGRKEPCLEDFHTLLVKFAASEATDERDKIFALLGISSDTYESKMIIPDYRKETWRVIQEAWSYLLFREIFHPSLHWLPVLKMNEFLQILDHLPEWTLDWSLREGRDEIVLRLFGTGGFYSSWGYTGRVLLCDVAKCPGRDDLFERMVSHEKVQVNVVDGLGDTALHKAIQQGHRGKVKVLLKREDILLNSANLEQVTPLIEAVQRGEETIVNLLLAHPRIDVNCGDKNRTPIAMAVRFGYEGIVRALLTCQGIDINRGGFTPLVEAVRVGRCQLLRQLLDSGLIDANFCDDGGAACRKAREDGSTELLSILLSHL